MSLDTTYQAAVRRLGDTEERGDLEAYQRIEQDLAAVAQLYSEAIDELRAVGGITRIGLSLKGEVLTHLLDRFEDEACEEVLDLILAFSEDVSAAYSNIGSAALERLVSSGSQQPDVLELSATIKAALELRQAQVLTDMAIAADADPATAGSIEAEFRESGEHLANRLTDLATCEPRTTADVMALAEVVVLLLRKGVGAEGFAFVLPLSLRLCDIVLAQIGYLPL
jgi:hypothetical protein